MLCMISFLSDDMGKKIALAKKASYFAYYVQAVSTVQKNTEWLFLQNSQLRQLTKLKSAWAPLRPYSSRSNNGAKIKDDSD